jgi:hypothetical protein
MYIVYFYKPRAPPLELDLDFDLGSDLASEVLPTTALSASVYTGFG